MDEGSVIASESEEGADVGFCLGLGITATLFLWVHIPFKFEGLKSLCSILELN